MTFIFLRTKRRTYALSTASLAVIPLVNLLYKLVIERFAETAKEPLAVFSIVIFIGLIVSCLLLGLSANSIQSKRSRIFMLVMSGVFNAALGILFIWGEI